MRCRAATLALFLLVSCTRKEPVELRPFPYPYRAGLAIGSDCDEMDSPREFMLVERYLADTGTTPLGEGLGLEVSQSFWFYDATGRSHFTYFEDRGGTPSPAAPIIEEMVASGYIDCMHTYGEFSGTKFDRRDAVVALRAVEDIRARNGVTLRVWTHHGQAENTQNLGPLPWELGDNPEAAEYHADLLLAQGVKFIDRWDMTHIIGQNARREPLDYLKEGGVLLHYLTNTISGREEVPYLWTNRLVYPVELDDGQLVYAFRRFISSWGGGSHDTPGLAEHLSAGNLRELVRKGGFMILYTHLGGNEGVPEFIPSTSRMALDNLASLNKSGEILVTTTARLLVYNLTREKLVWSYQLEDGDAVVRIESLDDVVEGRHQPRPSELMGVTFYVPSAQRARVFVGSREILDLQRNPSDQTGRESVGFPWRPLVFPHVETDASWVSAGPTLSAATRIP